MASSIGSNLTAAATAAGTATGAVGKLKSVQFEVFGKVQGVFFRKNTKIQAKRHELVGWVMNTTRGTVVGVAQGPEDKLDLLKHWLSEVGSKHSRIERCLFKDEKVIIKTEYRTFDIKK